MNKPKLKSKTLNGVLVVALMLIMQILGVGEAERARTYDEIGDDKKFDNTTELIGLGGAALAYYGRTRVGKGKDED